MPRKTQVAGVAACGAGRGFNEAAARCRGKPGRLSATIVEGAELQ